MPQMAPLWWEYLFILFSMMMIMMMIIIYHNPYIKTSGEKPGDKKPFKQMNWKW
uniref:ATP synthase F0 subunit 8 n=1 Tax=Megacopta horvathi TaxID=2968966 RepID=UPI0022372CE8|nr:ATP synthase F0 subunit 8 [Megacopta horvathi]UYA97775.1 ATP synthase F0 subunit 8 [Megacopta horvathi]